MRHMPHFSSSVARPYRHGRMKQQSRALVPYLFVAPFLVSFIVFMLIPLLVAMWDSLFAVRRSGLGFDGTKTTVFVGSGNYIKALHDERFMAGFARILAFSAVQVPIMVGLALALALTIDSAVMRHKGIVQIVMFAPYAVPTAIAAMLWGFLYQPGVSPVVGSLRVMGIDVDLLSPNAALWSTANITTWCCTGVNVVMLYAALQTIPREVYEAARLDGANEWQIARFITIPLLAPTLAAVVFLSVIGALQLFNEPTVLRTISSNVSADFTPLMAVVNTIVIQRNEHLGAAMSVIMILLAALPSVALITLQRRWAGWMA